MLSYRPKEGYILVANETVSEVKARKYATVALKKYMELGHWAKMGSFRILVDMRTELPETILINGLRKKPPRVWRETEITEDFIILG